MRENQLIALLAPTNSNDCVKAYEILSPLGIVLEIALRTPAAMEGIMALLIKYPDALILAGTVMTQKQANSAMDAGVAGIISADYISSVVETCIHKNVMCVPGGTADAGKQLAQKAQLYNCDFEELAEKYPYQWIYKLFPAVTGDINNMGLASAWRGPYKNLTMIYTGGINIQNLDELVKMDPGGIFCGSALAKSLDNPEQLFSDANRWISIIKKNKRS